MRWLIAFLAGLFLPTLAMAQEQGPAAPPVPVLRIVATDFVLPAKYRQLQGWAREAGYRIEWSYVEEWEGGDPVQGASILLLDGPRPNDMAAVVKAVGDTDALQIPWIKIGGGPPGFGNIGPAAARALIGYYAGGGEGNLRAFVAAVPLVLEGKDLAGLPAPQSLPRSGLWHPAAGKTFTSPEDFGAWLSESGRAGRPVVSFAISEGQLRDMQTAVLDALTRSAEARGLAPVFIWYDEADPQALDRFLRPLGAQALVNLTHMQNGDARRAEFEALDIPVLQAIMDRSGTAEEWRRAVSGVGGMSAAVMLSVPESWGVSDPLVIGAVEEGAPVPIAEQVELLTAKLARLAALRAKPPAEKHLALFFWNYPNGEKNLAASHLNLPLSLARLSTDLAAAGYDVKVEGEQALIAAGQAMLGGLYRPETLDDLLARGLAVKLPISAYQAWFETLPASRQQEVLASWGPPEKSPAVRNGAFIIPRLQLGKLSILPQPPRGGDPARATHDLKLAPDHRYLATYLWARSDGKADAIIHFGTHGTQEWTPGKDRGLWAGDYPFLLLGDLPVFYPYIQDNVAEAIQARRRGRAVTVSHQTPPFAPSGLYDELRDIHVLIHQYAQLEEGPVRDRVAAQIVSQARSAYLDADLGWSDEAIAADFTGYYSALHDHLHQMARSSIPLGLHVFGEPAGPDERLTTVMQQLGPDFLKVLGEDPQESFAEDFSAIRQSKPYRTLARYLREGGDIASVTDPALREQIERAAAYDRNLAAPGETEALLAGLAGRFVRGGAGGDPVRNPEVPSGRNLYAFEAEKVPAPAAYEEGGKALDRLIEAYRAGHQGEMPKKLAFSMFSGETIRTLGIGEGQILHALGLRPVWGRGGRVERLEIVPQAELGRPRIDVVMQPTSVYRDQFDAFMRLLADGIDRIAALDEQSGPAANARAMERQLIAQGIDPARARDLSRLRIFTNAPGDYGTGLPDAVLKDSGWQEESDLADPFLARMQYAYGAREWGLKLDGANLFAEQLRGVDAAVLMRSSNLHGLLSTDHPFEHLGGLSLAIRSLTGKSPDLFVTDMRGGEARMTTAASFLSEELRARYLNPQWIGAMQGEGYAGANEMLAIVNNLWGWQVADPASVRADQWQAMHDTYVRDTRNLGLDRFFEQVHPTAQLQIVERMLEAVRRDYWRADEATRHSLEQRRAQLQAALAKAEAASPPSPAGQGFGLAPAAASMSSSLAAAPEAAPARAVAPPSGRILQKLAPPPSGAAAAFPLGQILALAALLLFFVTGALAEVRRHLLSINRNVSDARA
ncbi:MAG TPA: cobaltochelatase subunit CobN [Sphingomonadaceae bacterium]|nr:cobaltochelatase subunit CobN [Sphingomonadaceae bacterium]